MNQLVSRLPPIPEVLKRLGPGLITGAADDDPSGIATYSQAGAQFGYGMLWTVILTLPLMVGIQMVSARIGVVTGRGLAANLRRLVPRPLLYANVLLFACANLINIAADIAAMADAARLVIGTRALPAFPFALGFGALCLALQVFLRYQTYVRYLKWLTLALLAYVAVVFSVQVPWTAVAMASLLPQFKPGGDAFMMIVAVFGTTISPYLFFWQAAQEVEDLRADPARESLRRSPQTASAHLHRIKVDTWMGMGFSNLVAFFIIVSTAATLHAAGVTNIQTSAQAAQALRPLAGDFAFALFALGIIGTGLLAVPVLAGSTAYAVAETFGWSTGLDLKWPAQGRGFYAVVALATLGGALIDFLPVDPIRALFASAVINGVIAVPIMALMMLLGSSQRIMGRFVLTRRHRWLGWSATGVMVAAVVVMIATAF
jgi:NRAMP (natural resistance-associated macrophage protein)-like metal ion transporter